MQSTDQIYQIQDLILKRKIDKHTVLVAVCHIASQCGNILDVEKLGKFIKKINTFNQQAVDNLVDGCDIIFNLIGILAESKKNKFEFVHCKIPEMIANSAQKKNIRNLIHISALNVNKIHSSSYANSKFLGEKKIREILLPAEDVWLSAKEAVKYGIADKIVSTY